MKVCGKVSESDTAACEALEMQFVNAPSNPPARGLDPLPGVSHYLVGNDPADWHTHVPQFGRVRYEHVYPGVDVVFYGNQGQLEYDFIVDPGADPGLIRMEIAGADSISVVEDGDLVVSTATREFRQRRPIIYQEICGRRRDVAGEYQLSDDGVVSFSIDPYDETRPLVIDPVLVYSTYLGKLGTEHAYGVAVDAQGNAYVVGETLSFGYPTVNAFQHDIGGAQDAFVSKLSPGGGTLLFSTFLGGSDVDTARGVALDSDSNIYLTGQTISSDFPTQAAIQKSLGGWMDAFMVKMNPSGSALLNSTYLGGTRPDMGHAIAVDDDGYILLTGVTRSSDFPTFSPLHGQLNGHHGSANDVFVTKLASTANFIFWSTYLGGSDDEQANAIAADRWGNVYVGGRTFSTDFQTTNADQGSRGSGGDAYLAQIHYMGWSMAYSTYLGGGRNDTIHGIVVDENQNAYVVGETVSTNFPTLNAYQPNLHGNSDTFLAKYSSSGARLYSTYLGGSRYDRGRAVARDRLGGIYVAGYTDSTDFPLVSPAQSTHSGSNDMFVTRMAPGGRAISYSTYLGGSDADWIWGLAVGPKGNLYLAGYSSSTDFPTLGAVQPMHGGNTFPDAIVAELARPLDFFLAATPVERSFVSGSESP
jgi:hypothetical protein